MNYRSNTIVVEKKLLHSKAYWALKIHAIRVLLRLYEKRQMEKHKDSKGNARWTIKNNGELVFTYQEAMNFGISKKQFCMALDELIEKGFLEITCQGTGPGQPSTYKLTERWQAYGTKDFYPARPRRKNKANNSGWAIYNDRQKQKLGVNNDTSSGVKKNTCSTNTLNNLVAKSTLEKEAGNIVYD